MTSNFGGAFLDPFHHVIHLTLHYPPRAQASVRLIGKMRDFEWNIGLCPSSDAGQRRERVGCLPTEPSQPLPASRLSRNMTSPPRKPSEAADGSAMDGVGEREKHLLSGI